MISAKDLSKLIQAAVAARRNAYCPYSRYPVGASVLTGEGKIFAGCNVENASSGLSLCAERNAIMNAVAQGHTMIKAVCVVCRSGKPCGACRQVALEFAADGAAFYIVDVGSHSRRHRMLRLPIHKSLPHPFDPLEAELIPKNPSNLLRSAGASRGRSGPRRARRIAR